MRELVTAVVLAGAALAAQPASAAIIFHFNEPGAGQPAEAAGPDFQQNWMGGLDGISPIPEPASWGLVLAGFGAVGYAMRRRRRKTVNFT